MNENNDTIRRQDAIDAITNYAKFLWDKFHETCNLAGMIETIEGVPSAQQWIPVSERLPKVGQSVLLSVGKGMYTAEGFLKDNGTWAQYRWSANLKNVDAWAEMPEPWKGEQL